MNTSDKVNQLIMQLLRDTHVGKVAWHIGEPPRYLAVATDNVIPVYYNAKYRDVEVAVYEARYKYFHDEENYTWSSEARFALLKDGVVIYDQRHTSPALQNLMISVRENAGGLDAILNTLLS